ncbi:Acyl-[acyl-carrier-protein] hydrolase [Melia azedarach]|uniref:Acyl-[acyl-carrier-protein] hydrolase n=1 Tax=Melia azedarach TaxID=155640 RepID=A0ACC1Y3L2_MELAZ|nr:Acyl-[acyl-carrier-protein] hydrolase [Melia azedarach]
MAVLPIVTPCSMNMKTTIFGWQGNNHKPKFVPAAGLQLKANIQALPTIDRLSSPVEFLKSKQEMGSTSTTLPDREIIINQVDRMAEPTTGRMVEDGLVFRQYFTVRSFDIGSDFKMSVPALMNYLQETALNHLKKVGLMADGFGSSTEDECKQPDMGCLLISD